MMPVEVILIFNLNVENVNDPPVFVPTLTWNMGWQEISELSYAMTYEHFKMAI